jgi:hypothetical protein
MNMTKNLKTEEEVKSALKCFDIDALPNYKFVDYDQFKAVVQDFTEVTRELKDRIVAVDPENFRRFSVWAIDKKSELLAHSGFSAPTQIDSTRQYVDNKPPDYVIVNSFNRQFQDRSAILRSFLYYLSRHYKSSTTISKDEKKSLIVEYFSPLACIHQSSGSGKSRLSNEISPYLFPIVLSCANESGFPKESVELKKFLEFMLSLNTSTTPLPHVTCLMNIVNSFFVRVAYFSIDAALKAVGYTQGTSRQLTKEQLSQLFSQPIYPSFSNVDILDGFSEYVARCGSNPVRGINLVNPANSVYDTVGMRDNREAPTIQGLQKLLEEVRKLRHLHLVENLKRNEDETGSETNDSRHKKMKTDRAKPELEWLPHVLFVLDEAQHLLSLEKRSQGAKKGNIIKCIDFDKNAPNKDGLFDIDLFRLIRRTLGFSNFYWKYCWGTTISTNTAITNFTPRLTNDPSLRFRSKAVLVPPFIYTESMDVMAVKFQRIDENSESLTHEQEGQTYLSSWERVCDILSCGRPLYFTFVESFFTDKSIWKAQIKEPISTWSTDTSKAFNCLYTLIEDKMSGGMEGSNLLGAELVDYDLVYALLSSAVGLYGCPSIVSKEDLVRRRLGWIVAADTEDDCLRVDFPSEGVPNILAGHILFRNLHTFLKKFNGVENYITFFARPATQKSFSTWQVTEILCRMMFLFAHNSAPHLPLESDSNDLNLKLFGPRLFQDVLSQIVTVGMAKKFLKEVKAEGCQTFFGHFQECDGASSPVVSCKAMLYRGSARYLPKNHMGADFMLPLEMKGGELGLALVQVKGLSVDLFDDGNFSVVMEAMRNCTLHGVFGMNCENDLRLGKEEIERRRMLQEKYNKFPVVRILVNISCCRNHPHNGARIFEDVTSKFLVIQTDGSNIKALKTAKVTSMFQSLVRLAGESFEENLPKYTSQFREPPLDLSDYVPFNPVYRGILHDNDKTVFGDHLGPRPEYRNI